MAHQELLDYIQEQIKNGYTEEVIRKHLHDHKWPADAIEEAFQQLKNPAPKNQQTEYHQPDNLLVHTKPEETNSTPDKATEPAKPEKYGLKADDDKPEPESKPDQETEEPKEHANHQKAEQPKQKDNADWEELAEPNDTKKLTESIRQTTLFELLEKADKRPIVVIGLLVLIYPLGLLFMWKWMKKWETWIKLTLSVLLLLPFLAVISVFFYSHDASLQYTGKYDRQRYKDIHVIYKAVHEYINTHDGAPLDLENKKSSVIGNKKDEVDLCADLVPVYLPDIPIDPVTGTRSYTSGDCLHPYTTYSSGYKISYDSVSKKLSVGAQSDSGKPIIVSD